MEFTIQSHHFLSKGFNINLKSCNFLKFVNLQQKSFIYLCIYLKVVSLEQNVCFDVSLLVLFYTISSYQGLSDYTKWLTHYSTKQKDNPAKPITCRSYAR